MEMAFIMIDWQYDRISFFFLIYGTVKEFCHVGGILFYITKVTELNPWWIVKITDLPLGSGSDNCYIESPFFMDFFVVDLSECIDRWYYNYTECWSALHFQVTKNPLDKFCVFSFCWFLITPTEFISMKMFWWWISTVSNCF